MRIRSTKPEFWRSERISSVGWGTRLVLKGLESYVDDNGVGKDDMALIVADVFPRDLSRNPTGTIQKVSEAISELENAGLVWRYTADRNDFIYISFWESVQRIDKPSKGRNRRPDGTMEYRDSDIGSSIREDSGSSTGVLPSGTGEQGSSSSSSEKSDDAVIEDPAIESLCEHLADRIEANGSPRPKISKKWRDSARLMMSNDQRTYDQIRFAIDWSQGDEFWRSNVLSMPKLREKFDQMRLSAQRNRPQTKSTTDDRVRGHLALAAEFAARETNTDQLEITS